MAHSCSIVFVHGDLGTLLRRLLLLLVAAHGFAGAAACRACKCFPIIYSSLSATIHIWLHTIFLFYFDNGQLLIPFLKCKACISLRNIVAW